MKKLRLDFDALAVQSFATGIARAGTGTVQGMSRTTPTQSPLVCPDTEWWSCGIVCLWTLETNPCNC